MTVGRWLACLVLFPSVIEAQPTEPSRAAPTSVRKVLRDCALTVWGCANRAGHSNDSEYEQIIQRARSQLVFSHTAPGVDLSKTVTELLDATKLTSNPREAWVTLAVIYAEQGNCTDGYSLFESLLATTEHPATGTDPLTPPTVELLWKDRQTLRLGLSLCHSLRGEHERAATQYRRMILHGGPSQRLLYRLADTLLADGHPDEAVPLYRQACLELPPVQPQVLVARSCAGLLVALDRSYRQRPTRLLSQLRRYDLGLRFLKMTDFVPAADRDYSRALLLSPSCEREALLRQYLHATPPSVPQAYRRRAEEHLMENQAKVPGCTSQTEPPLTRADGVAPPPPAPLVVPKPPL